MDIQARRPLDQLPLPAPSDKAPQSLSPSALETYRVCPRRFWFRHVRRLPVDRRNSPASVLGLAVHAALARFHMLPQHQREPERMDALLRQAWKDVDRTESFADDAEEAGWGRSAIGLLRRYLDHFDGRVIPAAVEETVSVRVEDCLIRCRVDRVDRSRTDSGLEIVDYKTGSVPEPADDLAASAYALAVREQRSEPVTRVRYLGLGTAPPREASWNVEMEDLARARRLLSERVQVVRADKEWSAVPGRQCSWCEFSSWCAARLTAAEGGSSRS